MALEVASSFSEGGEVHPYPRSRNRLMCHYLSTSPALVDQANPNPRLQTRSHTCSTVHPPSCRNTNPNQVEELTLLL